MTGGDRPDPAQFGRADQSGPLRGGDLCLLAVQRRDHRHNAWIAAAGGRYPATANYDTASGWGSANATELEAALASPKICPWCRASIRRRARPAAGTR